MAAFRDNLLQGLLATVDALRRAEELPEHELRSVLARADALVNGVEAGLLNIDRTRLYALDPPQAASTSTSASTDAWDAAVAAALAGTRCAASVRFAACPGRHPGHTLLAHAKLGRRDGAACTVLRWSTDPAVLACFGKRSSAPPAVCMLCIVGDRALAWRSPIAGDGRAAFEAALRDAVAGRVGAEEGREGPELCALGKPMRRLAKRLGVQVEVLAPADEGSAEFPPELVEATIRAAGLRPVRFGLPGEFEVVTDMEAVFGQHLLPASMRAVQDGAGTVHWSMAPQVLAAYASIQSAVRGVAMMYRNDDVFVLYPGDSLAALQRRLQAQLLGDCAVCGAAPGAGLSNGECCDRCDARTCLSCLYREAEPRRLSIVAGLAVPEQRVAVPVPCCTPGCGEAFQVLAGTRVVDRCAACGARPAKLSQCAACGQVAYCSKECQRKGWREVHKAVCKLAKANPSASAGAGAGAGAPVESQ